MTDVLSRENLLVIGNKEEERYIKKFSGADRHGDAAVGTSFLCGTRYYTTNFNRKTFAYNSDGYLYSVDELGNKTQILGFFSPLAVPTFLNIRVSGTDVLYFMEGISTGMYSYDGNAGNVFSQEIAVSLNFVGAVSYLDRMFAFEEDSEDLYFSKNLVPTNFTDSTDAGIITIGASGGSKIQAIMVYRETLFIFKNDKIWVLEGRTPSTFQVREVHTSLGLAARHSIQKVESGIMFYGTDFEWHSFGGSEESTKLLTYNYCMGGDMTKDLLPIVNRDRVSQMRSIYHNKLYRCAFVSDEPDAPVYNTLEYIFNTINETDGVTRGNNVSCYIVYDKIPDKNELFTGRSDNGRLMRQYVGTDWDNQDSTSIMNVKTQTKFVGLDNPQNMRVRRYWAEYLTLQSKAIPVKMRIDARNAASDETRDNMTTYGEYKAPTSFVKISSQDAITSRQIPRHGNAKCQNFSLLIDENIQDLELALAGFKAQVITKNLKRSNYVGV